MNGDLASKREQVDLRRLLVDSGTDDKVEKKTRCDMWNSSK